MTPFIRVEVSRPAGTPHDLPSRISVSWLWLQRMAQSHDPAGRLIERPQLHRFDVAGEVVTTYGTWACARPAMAAIQRNIEASMRKFNLPLSISISMVLVKIQQKI